MSSGTRTPVVDASSTSVTDSLGPGRGTGETVTVAVDARLVRGARSALGYLDDADELPAQDRSTIEDVRMHVESLDARVQSQSRDSFTEGFAAGDLVLLVSGLLGVARHYSERDDEVAADFHRLCAKRVLDALVDQRPDLVDNLRVIAQDSREE
ncbi:hypothetical protein [Haloarchaeobius sp. DFWS5]|uniref:hypothetical protein n=1 Tax=Haloarchaeobius sp. DFWS5 TaxID=3446114 RepID=UPI003EBBEB85